MISKSSQWRVDSRYSAALLLRWMRKCSRMGANWSNADIRKEVLSRYGW